MLITHNDVLWISYIRCPEEPFLLFSGEVRRELGQLQGQTLWSISQLCYTVIYVFLQRLHWLNIGTQSTLPKHKCSAFSSVQFNHSVVYDSLRPHGLQHTRPPCPSPTPRVYTNSCPLSQWCHPTISSSVIPFFSCLQSFPASGSFPMSQFFASGDHSIGVSASASVLPMNIQDWSPLGWTGWISLQS